MTTTREIQLKSRPEGTPGPEHFALVERQLAAPAAGEILVQNLFMSVDPYMRGRMRDTRSYVPPFEIGKVLDGGSVGRVLESRHSDFSVGDVVLGMQGWREHYISDGSNQRKLEKPTAPLSAYLGVLGMPGMTAYVGLLDIGAPKEGETVLVSAAAGAVGSVVGQIAKIRGCHVVGSAGSDEKVAHLLELGFDEAFNYKTEDLHEALKRTCPRGIDIYFENVGGALLEAALLHMRPFGRIPVCGMISLYNASKPQPGPSSIISVIPNRLKIQGFIVSDHNARLPEFMRDMSTWIAEGRVRSQETVLEGIEQAPQAFIGLFSGRNEGKMVVKLG